MIVKRRPCLYICVTKDKYRLPIAVADSPTELAEMLGVHRTSVTRANQEV